MSGICAVILSRSECCDGVGASCGCPMHFKRHWTPVSAGKLWDQAGPVQAFHSCERTLSRMLHLLASSAGGAKAVIDCMPPGEASMSQSWQAAQHPAPETPAWAHLKWWLGGVDVTLIQENLRYIMQRQWPSVVILYSGNEDGLHTQCI